jgi:hypothetical protein
MLIKWKSWKWMRESKDCNNVFFKVRIFFQKTPPTRKRRKAKTGSNPLRLPDLVPVPAPKKSVWSSTWPTRADPGWSVRLIWIWFKRNVQFCSKETREMWSLSNSTRTNSGKEIVFRYGKVHKGWFLMNKSIYEQCKCTSLIHSSIAKRKLLILQLLATSKTVFMQKATNKKVLTFFRGKPCDSSITVSARRRNQREPNQSDVFEHVCSPATRRRSDQNGR